MKSAWILSVGVCVGVSLAAGAGCSSKPAGSVSASELQASRESYAKLPVGTAKNEALEKLGQGNKVKLGSASIDGAMIEEWKYEAFVDKEKQGRDLFVTFLYFCNDRLVDTSDTRIDFRNNAQLVERWRKSAK